MAELVWACEAFATLDEFFACTCDCEIDPDNGDHVDLVEAAIIAASDEIALLSGHSVRGVCSQTVQFCRQACSCRGHCSCDLDTVNLPGPVAGVSDVSYEGYVFDADDFQIVNGNWLAWTKDVDGLRRYWPTGVDVDITFTYGNPVDEVTKKAALELACATVKACITEAYGIGNNPGSVNRQGIAIVRRQISAIADTAQQAAATFPWMAKFLALYNPTRATHMPFFYNPDGDDLRVLRPV